MGCNHQADPSGRLGVECLGWGPVPLERFTRTDSVARPKPQPNFLDTDFTDEHGFFGIIRVFPCSSASKINLADRAMVAEQFYRSQNA
jgi:hypothetical protein